MRNWRETLYAQFAGSKELAALLALFNEAVDPAADIEALRRKVLDPATAEGWGLDVWGRIVGIGRAVEISGSLESFGFSGSGLQPFNEAPFYFQEARAEHVLADRAYRLLILLKAASNLAGGSLADINRLLAGMFAGRGSIAVLHIGTMTLRFVARFYLEPYELALLRMEDMLPKPAGVGHEWYYVPEPTFGFAGSGLHPFNQGTFAVGEPYADS